MRRLRSCLEVVRLPTGALRTGSAVLLELKLDIGNVPSGGDPAASQKGSTGILPRVLTRSPATNLEGAGTTVLLPNLPDLTGSFEAPAEPSSSCSES